MNYYESMIAKILYSERGVIMANIIEILQEIFSAQGSLFVKAGQRYGWRIAYAIAACVFLLFAAFSFHAVLWAGFYTFCHLHIFAASLAVFGVDLLIVAFFVILAVRSRDVSVAEERIRWNRDKKIDELKDALSFSLISTLLLGPVGRALRDRFLGKKK